MRDRKSHAHARILRNSPMIPLCDGLTGATIQSASIRSFRRIDRNPRVCLKLQPGISNGDPRHIDTAVRVLAHKAKLNGYAVEPAPVSSLSSFQINFHLGVRGENE
jgi:hypothetical protein